VASKDLPLLVVKIEDVPMTPSLGYFLSAHHWFVMGSAPSDLHLAQFAEAVAGVLASLAPPTAESVAENRNPALLPAFQLRAVAGPDAGTIYPLHNQRITIGSNRDCDVVLQDRSVSHCVCSLNRDAAWAAFLLAGHGSRNGVVLNGERLAEARKLSMGDEIRLGSTVLVRAAPPAELNSPVLL
jgi:Inner membrane component of T3SS, cytoplasmic domain